MRTHIQCSKLRESFFENIASIALPPTWFGARLSKVEYMYLHMSG